MGLADRDYMRERYRARQGLSGQTVWNDWKARRELDNASYFSGRWRARLRRHNALRRKLLSVTLMSLVAVLLVAGTRNHGWLAERFAALTIGRSGFGFPASGTVSVSSALDMQRVQSRLTVQGAAENTVVQLVDARTGAHHLSIYVRAFERVSVPAPIGVYRVRFIHGRQWADARAFFGRGTVQEEVIGAMPFAKNLGHVLDLRLGPDSNLFVRRLPGDPGALE